MYDYKLHVSLLIFVYSLMDSDERASLQKKKCVFKTNMSHEHVVQCFNQNGKHKPMIIVSRDISLQACGGWAGSSQNCGCRISIFPPNFVSHPFSSPILCMGRSNIWGDDPMFGSKITWWDVHQSETSMDDFKWMKPWT